MLQRKDFVDDAIDQSGFDEVDVDFCQNTQNLKEVKDYLKMQRSSFFEGFDTYFEKLKYKVKVQKVDEKKM